MSPAISKICITDHENTYLFVFLRVYNQSFLELKPHCSVVHGTVILCLFSKTNW